MTPSQIQALIDDLKHGLTQRQPRALHRSKRAGILVPILTDGEEPTLLLTRRADTLNAHRGEVAFPGGMWEEGDEHIAATALREAEEEVGLPPGSVELIGAIDDLIAAHSDVMVTPTIGVVRQRPQWKVNPDEVARIFEIPLSALNQADGWRIEHRSWKNRTIPIYFFDFDEETLWGLSAYATLLTLQLLSSGSPIDMSHYDRQVGRLK